MDAQEWVKVGQQFLYTYSAIWFTYYWMKKNDSRTRMIHARDSLQSMMCELKRINKQAWWQVYLYSVKGL